MKKKLNLLVIFIFSLKVVNAQQEPFLSGDMLVTPIWHNPASFGTLNKFSVNMIGQSVWSPIDGSPKSAFLNGEFQFDYANSNFSSGGGLSSFISTIGFFRTINTTLNYNVQVKLKKVNLSVGVAPGFQQQSVMNDSWISPTPFPDPNLPVAGSQQKFVLNSGLMLHSKKFYAGVSSTNLTAPRFDKVNYSSIRHYCLNTGYRFTIKEKYELFPSLTFMSGAGFHMTSGMVMFKFLKPKISFGFGGATNQQITGALGYEWRNFVTSYFYSLQQSKLSNNLGGIHEIRLAYRIKREE